MTTMAKKNAIKTMLVALEAQNSDTASINTKLISVMGCLYVSLTLLFIL